MDQQKKWGFIINPVAGGGYAASMDKTIAMMAEKHGIEARIAFTGKRGDATILSAKFLEEGYTHIIGVGGDGTFNEVAIPLINRKDIVTGLVPAGTGNDFIQILGFPGRFEDHHWDILFRGETKEMDCGSCNGNIFANGMGLGFDAQVAAENYTAPGEVKKGGKNKYIWHILKTLLFYNERKMIVRNGEKSYETDCFINTVSIGRRFAGGFFLTPKAIANDSLLDVCMIRRLNLPQRLKILTMVPKGTHIADSKVNYYQTDSLSLEFSDEVPYHIDGELYFAKKFEIRVIPAAVRIIYNPEGNHFFS